MIVRRAGATAVLGCGIGLVLLGRSEAFEPEQAPGTAPSVVVRSVTYFVSEGEPRSGYRASDRELAIWALETWERSAAGAFRLARASETEALVRVYWARPNGNYGETRPLPGGRPGAAVFVRPSIESLTEDIARRATEDPLWRDTVVYLTCLHEIGHALGLAHTADNRDIMYSFGYGGDIVEYFARFRRMLSARSDIPRASGLSDADIERLRSSIPKVFGGK
jgi:hypothetical protein